MYPHPAAFIAGIAVSNATEKVQKLDPNRHDPHADLGNLEAHVSNFPEKPVQGSLKNMANGVTTTRHQMEHIRRIDKVKAVMGTSTGNYRTRSPRPPKMPSGPQRPKSQAATKSHRRHSIVAV
jgi:hypothetical protein